MTMKIFTKTDLNLNLEFNYKISLGSHVNDED